MSPKRTDVSTSGHSPSCQTLTEQWDLSTICWAYAGDKCGVWRAQRHLQIGRILRHMCWIRDEIQNLQKLYRVAVQFYLKLLNQAPQYAKSSPCVLYTGRRPTDWSTTLPITQLYGNKASLMNRLWIASSTNFTDNGFIALSSTYTSPNSTLSPVDFQTVASPWSTGLPKSFEKSSWQRDKSRWYNTKMHNIKRFLLYWNNLQIISKNSCIFNSFPFNFIYFYFLYRFIHFPPDRTLLKPLCPTIQKVLACGTKLSITSEAVGFFPGNLIVQWNLW